MNKNITLFGILLAISLLVVGSLMFYSRNHYEDEYVYNPPETATTTEATQPTIPTDDSKGTVESKQLQYLIEEEKLAFDVYTAFYEKYDSQIFGNILQSESTHQDRVLELLNEKKYCRP
jgi:hypothetical protein